MTTEVRQFIYLDSQAVNSLLASMFMAVPQKVRDVAEETDVEGSQQSGKAGLNLGSLLNLGVEGTSSSENTERNLSQTDKHVNDQYRFSLLTRALDENDGQTIHKISEEDDFNSITDGEIVQITGTCKTDPLYPLLGALEYITKATSEAPPGNGLLAQIMQSQSDFGQAQQAYQLLYGGWVGLKVSPDFTDYSCGVVLDERQTWVNSYRGFRGENEYTILGRVQEQLDEKEIWDLVEALRVVNSATSDDEASSNRAELVAKVMDSIEEQQEEQDNQFKLPDLNPGDFIIEGPGMVIDPIAIYW
ncbi:hypothetical protein GL213_05415 [Halogeometricum borinquense]|uniref:Uncharacterized protein n=1 Tax=Halogeometricum borinquense (strain ATCC 700274 / DSM 11551 / JCM 10706 / KCTC 4070 / PR3) TaxID=469382 RepID=E4NQA9_HALBP|nr:hypothetical protein [Halogeometricum borinquense]ADQ66671.1 hypothetical protein Hbor_10810 [Halogeometricum borinquense DSM 11551]ELY30180.1 hypothetical protein C499_02903 [Halogeometricum borinquense DSM 11551]QIQ76008.1 hypothetical protein GL213_05415 [Halogeometricum borinquense]